MGRLLIMLLLVSTVTKTHGKAVKPNTQRVRLKGTHEFLPYEILTTDRLNQRKGDIMNATKLTINRFSVTADILIKYLNNTSIQNLTLHDITFEKTPENGKKIYLPLIQYYKIFVKDVELENESEKTFEVLRQFLLVEKQGNLYYYFIVQLGSKIFVRYGTFEFIVDKDFCWFGYFPPLPPSEVDCREISLYKQSVDLTTLSPRLKILNMFDVDLYDTTVGQLTYLHEIFNYFPQLTYLSIKYSEHQNYPSIFDLSRLQRPLDVLWFSHVKIIDSNTHENEHQIHVRKFLCEHCEFDITHLHISTSELILQNNIYKNNGFQNFISSIQNVTRLTVDESYNFKLDWLNGTAESLEVLKLANLKCRPARWPLIFPIVTNLSLLNIDEARIKTTLHQIYPKLKHFTTTDPNPDLLSILSAHDKLSSILVCFPKTDAKGSISRVKSTDFNKITYERQNNSWMMNEEKSSRGIPRQLIQYVESYIWLIWIISSGGLVGNVLIILIYSRQIAHRHGNSMGYIIINLSVYDCLLLILTQLSLTYFQIKLIMDGTPLQDNWWEETTEGGLKNLLVNPRGFNILWYKVEINVAYLSWLFNLQSKFIYPLSKAAYFGTVYTTLLLTLERYTAICFPFRVKEYFNLKSVRTYLIIFGILSISLFAVKGLESSYSSEYFDHWPTAPCGRIYSWERYTSGKNPLNYRLYRLLFQEIFWNGVMYFIPIPLLLGLNCWIWKKIRQSSALRTRSHTNHDQDTMQITPMLVCVSLVFVICNSISGTIVWYHVQNGADHLADVEIYSCLPLVINSSVNFIIYSLLGKKFREEFVGSWFELWRGIKLWGNRLCYVRTSERSERQTGPSIRKIEASKRFKGPNNRRVQSSRF